MKQTSEKLLLVDISAIREMIEPDGVQVTWTDKEKQIGEKRTKAGALSNLLLNVLNTSKMIDMSNAYK